MSDRRVVVLTIPEDGWMEDRNGDHLRAILVINGTFHHLEAIRVIDGDGTQAAASPDVAAMLDAMYRAGGDGPFETVTMRGAQYVLLVTPFQ